MMKYILYRHYTHSTVRYVSIISLKDMMEDSDDV